jgi:TonB family protein
MRRSAAPVLGLVLIGNFAAAQGVPKLSQSIAGVVSESGKQPTTIVEPLYPQAAREAWIQGVVSLDVVVGKTGSVEMVGCDDYCRMRSSILIQSAVEAVRKWKWDPLVRGGKSVPFRTVRFFLDETSPPIDICTVISNSVLFDRRIVNVSGTVQRVGGLKLLRLSHCEGSVVVADEPESAQLLKDSKYIDFEKAVTSPVPVALRGQFPQDRSPDDLGGKRLILERVLNVGIGATGR